MLELARSGADVAGVVSFRGGLDTPTPADAKNIKCKVLVLHGGDDPHMPAKDKSAFEKEMRAGGVDSQLVVYGEAVHAFTNAASGNEKPRRAAYDARADRRSWETMKAFFAEALKQVTRSSHRRASSRACSAAKTSLRSGWRMVAGLAGWISSWYTNRERQLSGCRELTMRVWIGSRLAATGKCGSIQGEGAWD